MPAVHLHPNHSTAQQHTLPRRDCARLRTCEDCLHRANARAILRRAPAIPPPQSAMAAAQAALARAQAENSAGNMFVDQDPSECQ